MSHFDQAFVDLMINEGTYSDDPNDSGGKTMFGITEEVARAWGYKGEMRLLTQDTAKAIYKSKYWAAWYEDFPYLLAFSIFDTAVNSGPDRAHRILQKVFGVTVDGIVGPKTLAAMKDFDPIALFVHYNAARLEFYTSLSNWQHFGKGWTLRVVKNLRTGWTYGQ